MVDRISRTLFVGLVLTAVAAAQLEAQDAKSAEKKPRPKFRWVNPLPEDKTFPGVRHGVYHSKLMDHDVGYCIYLPPGYDAEENSSRRYPVVYYLHGG